VSSLYDTPPLHLARLRVEIRPRTTLRLALEERGNVLRGALGTNLRRLVCEDACPGATTCTRRAECAYARLFEPLSPEGARFGAGNAPRPFLFRTPLKADPNFDGHRPLIAELRLFGNAIADFAYFIEALRALGVTGLADRAADVVSVRSLDWAGDTAAILFEEGRLTGAPPRALDLECLMHATASERRAGIEFLTPTKATSKTADAKVPAFPALVRRLRDRISMLCLIWEGVEWRADYAAIGRLADEASTAAQNGRSVTWPRRSTKTGQIMLMSGFRGTVTYEGIHPDLWPLLRLGQEIHAGRYTDWGFGRYRLPAPRTGAAHPEPG